MTAACRECRSLPACSTRPEPVVQAALRGGPVALTVRPFHSTPPKKRATTLPRSGPPSPCLLPISPGGKLASDPCVLLRSFPGD